MPSWTRRCTGKPRRGWTPGTASTKRKLRRTQGTTEAVQEAASELTTTLLRKLSLLQEMRKLSGDTQHAKQSEEHQDRRRATGDIFQSLQARSHVKCEMVKLAEFFNTNTRGLSREIIRFANDWCRRWESNPHGALTPRDFESRASASFTTPACVEEPAHRSIAD